LPIIHPGRPAWKQELHMKTDAIHAFMALPQDRNAWGQAGWKTLRNPEVFVCVEPGQEPEETVNNWNRVVDPIWAVTATAESASTPGGYKTTMKSNGRSTEVLYGGTREDWLLDVLGLNAIAKPDLELRLCKDSAGNSDLWFLPLAPNDWKNLETTCGAELVSLRFAPLPSTLDEFSDLLLCLQQPDPLLRKRVLPR
jgi:hypothetical protein